MIPNILQEVAPDLIGHKCRNLITHSLKNGKPLKTAVVYPLTHESIEAPIMASQKGLIDPIFIGPKNKMAEVAGKLEQALKDFDIMDIECPKEAAAIGVKLARENRVDAIMKGSLHTDDLLRAIVSSKTGLRTGKRLSHAFIMDIPNYSKFLTLTDCAMNITPTLEEKVDITQNAVELVRHALHVKTPRVAVLAAVESINPKMPATLDAAELSKMAERGQLENCLVDGPLAFDNAISKKAAQIKGIKSQVAGNPDILVFPNIESGNMVYKQLVYLAEAKCAGIVMGAKVPIILTSRADDTLSRITSCALARLYVNTKKDTE